MHISCMATKTITLEVDAYEHLRAAKRAGESFSEVVRRAVFPSSAPKGSDLLAHLRAGGSGVPEAYLDAVEAASETDQTPDNPWS
jgi:predicted CopG family antitoxin